MFTMTTVSNSGSAQFSLGSGVCDGRQCREKRHRAAKEQPDTMRPGKMEKDMVGRSGDRSSLAICIRIPTIIHGNLAQVMTSVVTTIRFGFATSILGNLDCCRLFPTLEELDR